MQDTLTQFRWGTLHEQYDSQPSCLRFPADSPHLRDFATHPATDRGLYYLLIENIAKELIQTKAISAATYEAVLLWKLYSNPVALGNVPSRLARNDLLRREVATRFARLVPALLAAPPVFGDTGRVVNTIHVVGNADILGLGRRETTTLPMRTTLLHFMFPHVVPIFDKMVLKAVGIDEDGANQRLDLFEEYVPFVWRLADKYAECLPTDAKESPIRMIEMALWITRSSAIKHSAATSHCPPSANHVTKRSVVRAPARSNATADSRGEPMVHVPAIIRRVNKYADGKDSFEIWIDKDKAGGLPYSNDVRVDVSLSIGAAKYKAGLRATERNSYVWICPDLKDSNGRKVRLADALVEFAPNQRVTLVVNGNDLSVV